MSFISYSLALRRSAAMLDERLSFPMSPVAGSGAGPGGVKEGLGLSSAPQSASCELLLSEFASSPTTSALLADSFVDVGDTLGFVSAFFAALDDISASRC